MKRILTTLLICLGIVAAPTAAVSAYNVLNAHDSASSIVTRGAVIRIGPQIYIHDNDSHAAVGIVRVGTPGGCNLQVTTDIGDSGDQIIAAIAEEDEHMSLLDVQAGVSGGGTYANIVLARNGKRICANDPIFGSYSNIWLQLTYLKGEG